MMDLFRGVQPLSSLAFRTSRLRLFARLLVLTLLFEFIISSSAYSQPGGFLVPSAESDSPGMPDRYRRLPRDPLTQSASFRAVQTIQNGDIVNGLEMIQEILDQESDFLFIEPGQAPRSMFGDLEKLVRAHREDYERIYGPTATQMLTEARTDGNTFLLETVVRRFALTNAGAEALTEFARTARDRGEVSLAARQLELLAGHPNTKDPRVIYLEAARILAGAGQLSQGVSLLKRHPEQFSEGENVESLLTSAVRPIPAPQDSQRYEWWTPFGAVDQSGQSAPAPALLEAVWRGELVDNDYDFPTLLAAPEVAKHLASEHRRLQEAVETRIRATSGRIAMPAPRPLIVNDLVITPGPGSLKAFHIETGKLEWNSVDIDETFDYLAKQTYSASESQDPVREEMRELFASVRGWRDLTSSSISTDGENVYAISNCQLVGTTNPTLMMQNSQRHSLLPQRSNRLSVYRLAADGKKIWSIGTGTEESPSADLLEPREIFFLGAPLPVDGRLYVLGEERGQIQLLELDPATGSIVWALGLLNPDRDLVIDDSRRLAGLMPAYSGGILICPTGEGGIAAVDPLKRQILWTHIYSESIQPVRNQILIMRMMRTQNVTVSRSREELLYDQRWFDSRVMIADEKVIYTPPDDNIVVCLNLVDGKPAWKKPLQRGQSIYAATVFENQLVLVSRSEIQSYSLADGNPVWKMPVPIPGPSGRGVRMGNQFLQPFLSGEVGVLDLKSGRLLTRIPMPNGQIPGNLIADGGRLCMQTSTGIVAFPARVEMETKIAETLRERPRDAGTLALLGGWQLQQGDFEAGIRHLKESTSIEKTEPGQQILAWALLDALRTDFATYRNQADLVDNLIQDQQQRMQFLQVYAQGLQKSGDFIAAFERYLQLLQISTWPEPLLNSEGGNTVVNSRWVLARLDELLSASDEATHHSMKGLLTKWIQDNADIPQLLQILPSFPQEWIDADLVLTKLAATDGMETLVHQREEVLQKLFNSDKPETRIRAAVQLLGVALRFRDPIMAARMLTVLESKDVPVSGSHFGETSAQIAANIRSVAENADLLHSDYQWLDQIQVATAPQGQVSTASFQIPLLGPPSEELNGWSFFLASGGASVECFDQHGRHRGRINTSYGGSRNAAESELSRYVCMHHHLALVVLLDRFLIIDLLSDPDQPKVLVTREFVREEESPYAARFSMSGIPRPGIRGMLLELRIGRTAPNIGPLTGSMVCFEQEGGLVAINPLTGAELWRKRDIPSGAEILGDEDYVLLKPGDQNQLIVLRAMDGGYVKTVPIPEGTLNCLARRSGDWGRYLPVKEAEGDQFRFQLIDPVRQTAVWKMTGPANTRFTVVSGQKVAFLTPDRKLSIRNGMTGKEEFNTAIPLDQPVEQIAVVEFPDQWVLLTNTRPEENIPSQEMYLRSQDLYTAQVDGPVFAVDKETARVQWTQAVSNQNVLTKGPTTWPLLVFNRTNGAMEALVINRRAGAVLVKRFVEDNGSGIFSWLTEANPSRVNLKLGKERIQFQLGVIQQPDSEPAEPKLPQQAE